MTAVTTSMCVADGLAINKTQQSTDPIPSTTPTATPVLGNFFFSKRALFYTGNIIEYVYIVYIVYILYTNVKCIL